MCGIFGIFGSKMSDAELTALVSSALKALNHRGPDEQGHDKFDFGTGSLQGSGALGHTRLSIVDVEHGHQPLYSPERDCILICNGEIYNHKALRAGLREPYPFATESDSEVLLALYRQEGTSFLNMLDGMFAFVLVDLAAKRVLVARDPVGIKTMVVARGAGGEWMFSSEVKALPHDVVELTEFPNGHFWDSRTCAFTRYFAPAWVTGSAVPDAPADVSAVRASLEAAVTKRLMADVEVGCFLSGGLDSSLVASIMRKASPEKPLHTFSVGLAGSPDLKHARYVAEDLGTEHHERVFTVEEGVQQVRKVIWHLESYDPGTIRSGVPMSLLTELAAKHVKVCLSGEGADEVFAGYLYFFDSPSPGELHRETVRKVTELHSKQVQFVDRLTMMNSLEGRVPFLDLRLLERIFAIRPEDKLPVRGGKMEKHMLRSAFEGCLPDSVLWRQKEQFGDGVGFGWIDAIKDHATKMVTDEAFAGAAARFPNDPPTTKEQYFYRSIFDELFPYKHVDPSRLVERWAPWSDPNKFSEPSGRAVAVHNTADMAVGGEEPSAAPARKSQRLAAGSKDPFPVS